RLQGNAQDMEDVVHDAFLKAHRRIRGLKEPSAFRAWLGSIVVNEVRIRLRRTRLMRVLRLQNAEPVDLDALASSDASPEVRAQLAQVYGLLRLMPTDERIAWTLRFVERHRLQDVAQLSECSLATAKRRLTGAQRFLDEHYVRGTPYAATDRDSSDSDSSDRDSSDRDSSDRDSSDRDSTRPGKLALTRERP